MTVPRMRLRNAGCVLKTKNKNKKTTTHFLLCSFSLTSWFWCGCKNNCYHCKEKVFHRHPLLVRRYCDCLLFWFLYGVCSTLILGTRSSPGRPRALRVPSYFPSVDYVRSLDSSQHPACPVAKGLPRVEFSKERL